MKYVQIQDLFIIEYGHGLSLNKLKQSSEGINFVSRTSKNNGISASVHKIDDVAPQEPGTITVSLGGSVLESFLQPEQFYTGYHIYCLKPKKDMSDAEKLYYCSCISANKYRYNYGRQANRTLKDLLIPDPKSIPSWINSIDPESFHGVEKPFSKKSSPLNDIDGWKYFKYKDLFEIERGRGPRRKDISGKGTTPFVSSSDQNNGWTDHTLHEPIHQSNTIGVNRNGSVAEAFYQPIPFCSTEDVHIFKPKFKLNPYIAMFLSTLIRLEKYRYNYGRKWGIARMYNSKIKLPVTKKGEPDWKYMEQFIKSLPFSKHL